MSAVIRCAGRALRRPSSFTSKQQRFAVMPMEVVGPRRLHCLSEPRSCMHRPYYLGMYPLVQPQRVKDSTLLKLDQISRCLDRDNELMERLGEAIRAKIKRDRRRRMLVRTSILGTLGAAFLWWRSSRGQGDHTKQ
ncbi:hypothetical protein EJB05_25923 [Eragrostis curvula]|uniref:Uncharacterized protein n=1 Tax=Eragrostis curvula TaxID=38414 RepID=A0A5J9UJL7_9POAL|nr:hypothetical protein EJB05_25885 [Eragrostis curvula]TVU23549.1 hypothetical protein EJB05_25923 [Eragrostis curvula]